MKLIMSHPTANANVRAAAIAFEKEQLLSQFFTTIASFPGDFLDKVGSIKPFSEVRRRQFDPVLQSYTHIYPFFEFGRILSAKFDLSSLTKHEKGFFSVDSVYKHLDKHVASKLVQRNDLAVYAYEDGAFQTFLKAKDLGLPRLYDLPIGYWRTAQQLLNNERELWPDWADTLTGFGDSEVKLKRKDEEIALSSQIFTASRFTANTLKDYPGNLPPVHVIPYGFPPINRNRAYPKIENGAKLKVLFVGGLSQRKGIANLFSVYNQFKKYISLTVVGRKTTQNCRVLDEELARVNWIESLPHNEILELMANHDILAFPSLFEGFGLVITEAMSQGTPVITTERTAGPDLIQNEENGWLTIAGSTDSLAMTIEKILGKPQLLEQVGRNARDTAAKRPWVQYGEELTVKIKNIYHA